MLTNIRLKSRNLDKNPSMFIKTLQGSFKYMGSMHFKIHALTLEKMLGGQGQTQKYMLGHETQIQ